MNKGKIETLNENDEDTISFLYDKYIRLLIHVAFSICRNYEEAKDIAHSAFLKAIDSLKSGKKVDSISAYLCSICRNLAIDYTKKARFIQPLDSSSFQTVSQEVNPASKAGNSLLLEKIEFELGQEAYNVLVYRIVFEYSFKEIGEILGKSTSSAIGIYHRAKKKLKNVLGGQNEKERI